MTVFKCTVCHNYSTEKKSHYERHLNGREMRRHKFDVEICQQIKEALHNLYPHKYPKVEPIEKKEKEKERVVELEDRIKKLEKALNDQQLALPMENTQRQQPTHITQINAQNAQVNNVVITNHKTEYHLHGYKEPDESMLTVEVMDKICENMPDSAPELFEIIYLNEDYPQNHVLYKNNRSSNTLSVFTNNGWVEVKEKTVLQHFREKICVPRSSNYIDHIDYKKKLSSTEYDERSDKVFAVHDNIGQIDQKIRALLIQKRPMIKKTYMATKEMMANDLQDVIISDRPQLEWVDEVASKHPEDLTERSIECSISEG